MTEHYPVAELPGTAEYWLSVIQDSHRQQCQFDGEADRGVELSFETTIEEWRDACDLIPWMPLSSAIAREWKLNECPTTWQSVLEPERERTLRDLCEFIAAHAGAPAVRPARLCGARCESAGVFLTIVSLLKDAGADVSQIRPSAALDEYARRHLRVFLGPISRLAPNAIPPVRVSMSVFNSVFGWAMVCFIAAMVIWLLAVLVGWSVWPIFPVITLLLGLGLHASLPVVTQFAPSRVEFGSMRTFRDLSVAVAQKARFCDDGR